MAGKQEILRVGLCDPNGKLKSEARRVITDFVLGPGSRIQPLGCIKRNEKTGACSVTGLACNANPQRVTLLP